MKKNNQILTRLLDLEVAGKDAISAPAKWTNKPLLNIETEVDEMIHQIAPSLISNNDKSGVWWFLVGSPGNGKSAAVGSLVRKIEEEHNAKFREPKKDGKLGRELSELGENEIPYKMELYEEGNSYASALFAQDASVVPNPYDESPDPGEALVNLLDDASSKGQAIVVCANRGIIEKALQQVGVNKKLWYPALKAIRDGKEPENIEFKETKSIKNNVFDKVDIKVTPLDKKSIFADGTFKKLVRKATSNSNWDECADCESRFLCPFKSNRNWLNSDDGLSRFVSVVRYGELMSGQALVFREALALISLMLSGSSRDYPKINPCEWVHHKIEKGAIFALLSRRIYMVLFTSESPFGLRFDDNDRKKQISILSGSMRFLEESSKKAIDALSKEKISTDIGLKRFLSREGVFSELDPVKENQGKVLEQRWNIDPNVTQQLAQEQALICDIEKKCFSVLADCDNAIDDIEIDANEFYRELRHWITSITYRLGFFAEGKILFENELDEYQKALSLKNGELSDDDDDFKDKLEDSLEEFVFGSESYKKIRISDVLTVYGENISGSLSPVLDLEKSKKSRLVMCIDDSSIEISPRSFVWLRRKDKTGMSNKTFPPDVHQDASDIRYKSASSINYAFVENKVNLDIRKPDDTVLQLFRKNGKLRLKEYS